MFNFSNTDFTRLLFVTNVLSNVKINDILVPGLVEIGRASHVTLDCVYSVTNGSDLLLHWYFKDNIEPVYEWRPFKEPIVKGVLEGHLDKLYRVSENPLEARRALRIYNLVPELSGEYTCEVQSGGSRASASKIMIVYKPQEDLSIDWKLNDAEVEVRCTTHGVYPKPDLLLERDRITLDNQHSRSWQNGRGMLYDAETVASFRPQELRDSEQFTCRLHLPETRHFAVKETNIIFRNSTYNSLEHHSHKSSINSAIVLTSNFGFNVLMYIFGTVTVIKKCV